MDYTKIIDSGVCNIVMKGKFNFSDHLSFKALFDVFDDSSVKAVQYDLRGVDFVDSAALGLLLLSLDEAKKASKPLILIGPQGQVQKMFEISRFYELFDIR